MGLGEVDSVLFHGGLSRGAVHEWIGVAGNQTDAASLAIRSAGWSPPLTMLVQIARRALASSEGGDLVWIGRAIWPYAPALASGAGGRPALDHSLFIHATRPAERLWATDLALRSHAAAAVIADGSGLDLAATRRLQLAAEAGGCLCLLARPPWERTGLSAATTRWMVRSSPSPTAGRRWTIELLRCKGMRPTLRTPDGRAWTLEQSRATRAVAVVPDIRDRPDQAETARRLG